MKVVYTPRAKQDLEEIYENGVASWGSRVAKRVERRIFIQCTSLSRTPEVGVLTDYADVRRLPIVRYPFTIFYRIAREDDRVEILRVVHSRSIQNLSRVPV